MSQEAASSVHAALFDEDTGFCGVSPKTDAYAEAESLLLMALLGFCLIHVAHWISLGTTAYAKRTESVRNAARNFVAVNLLRRSPLEKNHEKDSTEADLDSDSSSDSDSIDAKETDEEKGGDDKEQGDAGGEDDKKHGGVVNEAKIMLKAHDSGEARTRGQFQEVYIVLLLVMFYQYVFVEGRIVSDESRRCQMLYYASVVLYKPFFWPMIMVLLNAGRSYAPSLRLPCSLFGSRTLEVLLGT